MKVIVHSYGKSGQELKAVAWEQKLRQTPQSNSASRLAGLVCLALVLHNLRPLSGGGSSYNGMGIPTSIINSKTNKNVPQIYP